MLCKYLGIRLLAHLLVFIQAPVFCHIEKCKTEIRSATRIFHLSHNSPNFLVAGYILPARYPTLVAQRILYLRIHSQKDWQSGEP